MELLQERVDPVTRTTAGHRVITQEVPQTMVDLQTLAGHQAMADLLPVLREAEVQGQYDRAVPEVALPAVHLRADHHLVDQVQDEETKTL